jgi:hypothetical protein
MMHPLHFCTMFDHNYLPRGLVLYHSLRKQNPEAHLHVLCLSTACFEYLSRQNLRQLHPVQLRELEAANAELEAARLNRSWIEYIFTLSPCWPLYLMTKTGMSLLTMVDADAMFLGDPGQVMGHMETTSVGIVGHRFPDIFVKNEKLVGRYNVGFQSFKNDIQGLNCLSWWKARCLEKCQDLPDGDSFADQKYLDQWPMLFDAKEFPDMGLNVAPWNLDRFRFALKDGKVFVDNDPLVYFHFQGIKQISPSWWDVGLSDAFWGFPPVLKHHVYIPYLHQLADQTKQLKAGFFDGTELRASKRSIRTVLQRLKRIAKLAVRRRLLWILPETPEK